MSNQQKVQAGVVSDLFKMLFKGVDKLFDSAAEYQNDMGVLKQVNKIPVENKDGRYIVEVKLAPVKDKDGLFYIEVKCDDFPDFNAEGFNKQVIKLNKRNTEDLEKQIDQLLEKNGLKRIVKEDQGEDTKSDIEVIDCYKNDDYDDWRQSNFAGTPPTVIKVRVKVTRSTEERGKFDVEMTCDSVKLMYEDHPAADDLDNMTVPENEIDDLIDKVLHDSHLVRTSLKEEDQEAAEEDLENAEPLEETEEQDTPAASYLDVSLSYIKSSEEITMDAIYANYDISDAMSNLDQVIDNDDFVALLTEEPQSFRITDEGNDFDVCPIEIVDVSHSAEDIYNAIASLCTLIDAYSVNMDAQQQTAANEVLSALQKASIAFKPEDIIDEL